MTHDNFDQEATPTMPESHVETPAKAPAAGATETVPAGESGHARSSPLPGTASSIEGLNALLRGPPTIKDVSLTVEPNKVTAMIGPSGCGKSTVAALHQPHARGDPGRPRRPARSLLDGARHLRKASTSSTMRRPIGMVFQKPNPFPTMSIFDNVAAGLRLAGIQAAAICASASSMRCARAACGTRSRTG